jgi:hypothetical protein
MNSAQEWFTAMKEEMFKLVKMTHGIWLIVRITWSSTTGCLRTKPNADSFTKRLHARMVAKGHVQKAGTDYDVTFSPVAVRAVLAIAAQERLQIRHFDVKTAFLYGTLQDEVCMHQPEGLDEAAVGCAVSRKPLGVGIKGM